MRKSKKNTIFIIPFILPWDWSADYQRQTCFVLARSGNVVAYMQKDAVFFLKALWQKKPAYPIVKNVRFYRPLYWFPFRRFIFVERLNQWISYVLFELCIMWGKQVILWIFDPNFSLLPRITHGVSLYDCVDYHSGFHAGTKRAEIQKKERELMQRVDYFFVNSHALYDLHKTIRKPDAIVPQGFQLDNFRNPIVPSVTALPAKPIIGYIGALDYRLDVALLEKLIHRNPQWQFVLWGPMQSAFPVRFMKHVITGESNDRRKIVSIIEQFSIGIIPLDVTIAGVRYGFPMKLFEYFYMGKPVVSTEIEELKRFPKFVHIGSTVKEWEKNINSILSKPLPVSYKREQRKLAIANSWEKKVEAIGKVIKKGLTTVVV